MPPHLGEAYTARSYHAHLASFLLSAPFWLQLPALGALPPGTSGDIACFYLSEWFDE